MILRAILFILGLSLYPRLTLAETDSRDLCLAHLRNHVVKDLNGLIQSQGSVFSQALDAQMMQRLRFSRILLALMPSPSAESPNILKPFYKDFPQPTHLTPSESKIVATLLHNIDAPPSEIYQAARSAYERLIFETPLIGFIANADASDLQAARGRYLLALKKRTSQMGAIEISKASTRGLTLFARSMRQAMDELNSCREELESAQKEYLEFSADRPFSVNTMSTLAGACALGAAATEGLLFVVCGPPTTVGLGYSISTALDQKQEQSILSAARVSGQLPAAPQTELEERLLKQIDFLLSQITQRINQPSLGM